MYSVACSDCFRFVRAVEKKKEGMSVTLHTASRALALSNVIRVTDGLGEREGGGSEGAGREERGRANCHCGGFCSVPVGSASAHRSSPPPQATTSHETPHTKRRRQSTAPRLRSSHSHSPAQYRRPPHQNFQPHENRLRRDRYYSASISRQARPTVLYTSKNRSSFHGFLEPHRAPDRGHLVAAIEMLHFACRARCRVHRNPHLDTDICRSPPQIPPIPPE